MKANETNKLCFLELHKPRKLDEEENLYLIGTYKTTVILMDDCVGQFKHVPKYFHFLKYEGSHLKSCNGMSLKEIFQKSKHGVSEYIELCPYDYKIVTEIGKMIVISGTTIMCIIDLKTAEIMQALNSSIVEKGELYHWFLNSKNRKELVVVVDYIVRKYIFRFSLIYGFSSLKEQTIDFVINNFNTDKISQSSLPQSLVQEIISKKIYENSQIKIGNRNITDRNINRKGLHANFSGIVQLAKNFVKFIKTF